MPKNITPEADSPRKILDELLHLQTLYAEISHEIGRCMHGMLEMFSNQSDLRGLVDRFTKESGQSHLLIDSIAREAQAIIAMLNHRDIAERNSNTKNNMEEEILTAIYIVKMKKNSRYANYSEYDCFTKLFPMNWNSLNYDTKKDFLVKALESNRCLRELEGIHAIES